MSILNLTEQKMQASIEHLKDELKKIRTGKANPAMVDEVKVEVYGSSMKLRDVASVTSPESRQLLITPYDRNNTDVIGKAIEKANLGFRPIVDGNVVRINIPQMDESVQTGYGKTLSQKKRRSESQYPQYSPRIE